MRLTVNGTAEPVEPRSDISLLNLLRDDLGLTAAKPGCGEGVCGACTVLVDGRPVRSCVTAATSVSDSAVDTLEGLRDDGVFAALVAAFATAGAFQCGYCTPGMIVTAGALLRPNASPTDEEIVAALDGNICRCGTYRRIVQAVHDAADSLPYGHPPARPDGAADSVDQRFVRGADRPWDLAAPDSRDWFERLGDGLAQRPFARRVRTCQRAARRCLVDRGRSVASRRP